MSDQIKSLDGLRGIAILLVIVFHLLFEIHARPTEFGDIAPLLNATEPLWNVGATGVELFFVLSGFLLFLPFASHLLNSTKFPSVRKFYVRRALRILPAYWAALILIVIAIKPEYLQVSRWGDVGLHFAMLHNFTYQTRMSINSPFWTMAVETQFYLLLPIVAAIGAALVRWQPKKGLISFAIGIILFSPLYELFINKSIEIQPALSAYVPFFQVFEFLSVFGFGILGSLYYTAAQNNYKGMPFPTWQKRFFRFIGFAALAGICIFLFVIYQGIIKPGANSSNLLYNYFFGLSYGALLLAVLFGWASWKRLVSHPSLRFIGLISYSLYIWHLVIDQRVIVPLGTRISPDTLAFVVMACLQIIITLPLCLAFFLLFEKPFMKIRRAQHEAISTTPSPEVVSRLCNFVSVNSLGCIRSVSGCPASDEP